MTAPVTATLAQQAGAFTDLLRLTRPPVGVTFLAEPPAGVPVRTDPMPSACAMWRPAEREVCYRPALTHRGCAVGAVVLGVPLDEEASSTLAATVAAMTACGYLDAAEPAALPTGAARTDGVLYGPLADLPVRPDLALLWLSPRGAMLLAEAGDRMSWTGSRGLTLTGRPGCAALPLAEQAGSLTASLGCTGMRRFTGIDDDLLLAVLPGPGLEPLLEALVVTVAANTDMAAFYDGAANQLREVGT